MQSSLLIGGEFVVQLMAPRSMCRSHDGSVITAIAEAKEADVDRAVEAAQGVGPWQRMRLRIVGGCSSGC